MFKKLFVLLFWSILIVGCNQHIAVEVKSDVVLSEDNKVAKFSAVVLRENSSRWSAHDEYFFVVTSEDGDLDKLVDMDYVAMYCDASNVCYLED